MAEENKYKEVIFCQKNSLKLENNIKGLYPLESRNKKLRIIKRKIIPYINQNAPNNNDIIILRNNILKYLVIIPLIASILSGRNIQRTFNSKLISITLKVKTTGNIKLFNSYYLRSPNFIKINGDNQTTIKSNYNLNITNNII